MTSPTTDRPNDLAIQTHDLGKRFGERASISKYRAASRSDSSAPTARERPP
jgi:hypothetical protein